MSVLLRLLVMPSSASASVGVSELSRILDFFDTWDDSLPISPPLQQPVNMLVGDYLDCFAAECSRLRKPGLDVDARRAFLRAGGLVQVCVMYGPPLLQPQSERPSALMISAIRKASNHLRRLRAWLWLCVLSLYAPLSCLPLISLSLSLSLPDCPFGSAVGIEEKLDIVRQLNLVLPS